VGFAFGLAAEWGRGLPSEVRVGAKQIRSGQEHATDAAESGAWWTKSFNAPAAQLTFLFLGFILTWARWQRVERNRNVEDAMARKDKANEMIFSNARILAGYVGNVFSLDLQCGTTRVDNEERIKMDMFVFMEIDNLEFVFDKSRTGLIEPEYAVRAMKIFTARSENLRFAGAAHRLVVQGRYNDEFREAVIKLIFVGHRARLRSEGS
jgi:hypothetical protein